MGLATTSAFCFACAISAPLGRYLTARYPYTFDFEKWDTEAGSDEVMVNEEAKERKGKVKAQQESWTREQAKKSSPTRRTGGIHTSHANSTDRDPMWMQTLSAYRKVELCEDNALMKGLILHKGNTHLGTRCDRRVEKNTPWRVDNSSGPSRAEEATTSVATSFDVESDVDVPTRSRTSVDRR
ncbi:hypothetical protein C8R45DRAFT_923397 [Mycena sanguinolenta]|nr:hypothetical protein C8R45DRAFT_923397 [Mycena sanguinolenta]